MAGIEHLAAQIYHENQEPGSALCAQHALNSLLQGNYFTPSDLSTIAHSLDALEQHVDSGLLGQASDNMDDSGFFSIQVLENALNVWGQSLIRWRSEAMQPYHDRPQSQRAFILNCDQHWITLRRFGDPEGVGPWFNLNSSLDRPKWVSETYLGVWLQQAEADGYSTFVVVPTDPDHPLPQTDADVFAARVSQPGSSGAQYPSASRSPDSSVALEDEDFELQAALHASLDGAGRVPMHRSPVGQGTGGSRTLSPGTSTGFPGSSYVVSPPPIPPPSTRPVDQPMGNPVAASMARNQVMLERMRREQEAALREHYRDEASSLDGRPYAGLGNRVQDEEEQLRRALAESEEMARGQQGPGPGPGPAHARPGGSDSDAAGTGTRTRTQAEGWSPGRLQGGRVYDDEDAELQAALQASLESAPPEAHIPDDTAPVLPRAPHMRHLPLPPTFIPASGPRAGPLAGADDEDEDEDEDEVYFDGDDDGEDTAAEETPSDAAQAEDVSIEEMRRRRLARFGGP